jgi:hypothetical protein
MKQAIKRSEAEYKVEIITIDRRDSLIDRCIKRIMYERKAWVHGACIKLLTDNKDFKEMWEDNFKFMSEDIRPHGRLFAFDLRGELEVYYEPLSKTGIVLNCKDYGLIKSIALAIVGDFFEDYYSIHRRFSVHGSVVDVEGKGITFIGPPKSGKTTLSYGLLLSEKCNLVSDDWYYVRLFENGIVAYASEKNSYIREDLSKVWKQFTSAVEKVELDPRKRAVIDTRWMLGPNRTRESTNLEVAFLLERNLRSKKFLREVDVEEALKFMEKYDFCNPHQLVRNKRKTKLREDFFRQFFKNLNVYILNTIENPQQSLKRVKGTLTRSWEI